MKKFINQLSNKKYIKFYKKSIAVSLAFLILFNLSAETFANIISMEQLGSKEIQTEVRNILTAIEAENKTPQQFLADLYKQLEDATKDDNKTTTAKEDKTHKLTKEEYTKLYNNSINKDYDSYINKIETETQNALAAFDEEANKVIAEQRKNIPASAPSLNLKVPSNDKLFNKAANPLNPFKEKTKLNTATYQATAYQTQQLNTPTPEQAALNQLEADIAKQKEEYTKEVNTWKENTISDLKAEQTKLLSNSKSAYEKYSKEYNTNLKDFYASLLKETIENYKKTNDIESKKNFVSILFFLTSIKSPEIDRNDFIKGEDREFVLNTLRGNFSVKGNACAGAVKTIYADNSTWGSSAIGGSPSAGKMYDNSANKTAVFEFADKDKCDLALSSMLPYANLNGDGYALTNFIRQYYNSPTFGMMLELVVKSLLITNNRGEEALTKFIDESIALENKVRNDKGNLWDKLDIITFEGLSRSQVFEGKYCNHNLCSSADSGIENPNAWEEVAYMLADAKKTNLLNKAISQCKIVSTKNYYQHIECQGIYPFLFGAIISKPELANRIKAIRPLQEVSGVQLDEYGRSRIITAQEALENKRKNDAFDITQKYTQAQWIAGYLTMQSFEDIHPASQLRMNNLVAKSPVLNSNHKFKHIDENSKEYKKSLTKYNAKQVLLGITSYADFLIALVFTKDLIRFGVLSVVKAKNLAKFMLAIRAYKGLPNSFAKAVKLTRLLEATKFSPKSVARMNKFKKFNANPLHYTSSAVVARMGGESQAFIASVSGRITGVKNGVLIGTQEFLRPISGSYKGKIVAKQGALGGTYVVGGASALKTTPEVKLSFKDAVKQAFHDLKYNFPLSPYIEPDPKKVPNLDVSNLSVEIVDKKGNPIKIESMHIDDNVLYVNGKMFKTFKATFEEDQLAIINQLLKDHNITLGMDGFYIKPIWNKAPNAAQKVSARWKNSELVDIYDTNGNVIMKIGLNRGYEQDLALLNRLGIVDPKDIEKAQKIAKKAQKRGKKVKVVEENMGNKAKLIYTNGALYIEEAGNLAKLEGLTGLSLPKTALFNMTKGKQVEFLNALFSMPAKSGSAAPLKMNKTKTKIFWPFMTQALSYSAASSSLMMTMEKAPFNFSPASSVAIGLFLPYVWSFASPLFAPLVKMWGAKPVLLGSLFFAGAGLTTAIATGYRNNATNELDSEGRVIPLRDKDGNIIYANPEEENPKRRTPLYELKKETLPAWPLFIASGATGLASAGIRATANILIKGYELNKSTLTVSMLFKNVGGMAFTAVPFIANSLAKIDNDRFRDKRKDFSVTYPALLGLTLFAGTGIALRMPKMNIPSYKPVKADFSKPWKLLFTPQIAPYTIGMMGVCSLEGYVYFKGVNALARDTFEGYNFQPENAKFLASLFTAVPQFALRLASPRKVFYGRGLFNSALLATSGTLLMAIPSNHLSREQNTAIGAIAGVALGLGTAQVYQYSQKLVIAQAEKMPGAPVKDAQILYSMSNLGLILPTLFAFSANNRKANLNESEFEATRNTFYWPLIFYATGMSAIADAERGFKMFPSVVKNVVAPAARYSVEGAAFSKNVRNYNTTFKPVLQQGNHLTPIMQPTQVKDLKFKAPLFNPQYNIVAPAPTSQKTTTEETETNEDATK